MRQFPYTLAAFVLILVCCQAFAQDAAEDAKKLQGTWEIVELIAYGKKADFNTIKGTKFVFTADKLTLQPPSDKSEEFVAVNFTFKVNSKKKPAEVDLTVLDGKNKGVVSLGIYELKDDTLRWCQSDAPKADRPKDFTSPEKSAIYLFTLKRVTKK